MRVIRTQVPLAGLLLTGLLLAQNGNTPPGQVPDSTLYIAVFQRIQGTQNFAAQLAGKGKNSKALRDSETNAIGLTEAEYAAIEPIALDCLAKQTAYFQARGALLTQIRNQSPQPATAAQQAQMNKLISDNAAQIGSHIAQLQNTLGQQSFAKLDQWARKSILPNIGYQPIQKGGK